MNRAAILSAVQPLGRGASYEHAVVAITTNLSFSEWAGVFGDAKMTTAILDGHTHQYHIVETGSDSFHFRASTAATKGRKERGRSMTSARPPNL
jgi:DNA replication protein DnaC